MNIAIRTLVLRRDGHDIEIPIRIDQPERAKVDWICRFQIGWPEEAVERWGAGVDSMQALLIAMQMIGAEIYTSDHHKSGHLFWLVENNGYGFPMTNNARDLLIGDDKKYL